MKNLGRVSFRFFWRIWDPIRRFWADFMCKRLHVGCLLVGGDIQKCRDLIAERPVNDVVISWKMPAATIDVAKKSSTKMIKQENDTSKWPENDMHLFDAIEFMSATGVQMLATTPGQSYSKQKHP